MLRALFTLDYEIHGNGEGDPLSLMVEPTARLLDLFDQFGAKLTIMADVAEIMRFARHAAETGRDEFHHAAISEQLRDAVRRGHDVQLHLHSSYFNARHVDGRWEQDWSEYDFARLQPERMDSMVRQGKAYLETLLRPVSPDYRCIAFRAANWSVSPSQAVIAALLNNGIQIDSSVFKYGRRSGRVNFDYGRAHSALLPWRADAQDICRASTDGRLWEFPIYSEHRRLTAFFSLQRFYRACVGRLHRMAAPTPAPTPSGEARARPPAPSADEPAAPAPVRRGLLGKHAWKADFNQCTGGQLIAAIERASAAFDDGSTLPFVLIGHSKLFTQLNERSLRPFLAHVQAQPRRLAFGHFSDFTPMTSSLPEPQPQPAQASTAGAARRAAPGAWPEPVGAPR